jgi:hypothetical protein
MLTDMIVEEEFEIKEEEPWYDKRDLEHGTGSFCPFFVAIHALVSMMSVNSCI